MAESEGGGVRGAARKAGIAGAAIGAVAAGVAVERLTVHRGVRRRARLALDAEGPYGTLRGARGTAYAEDGTALHYEVEEAGERAASGVPAAGGAVADSARSAVAGDGFGGPSVPSVRLEGTGPPVRPYRDRLSGLLRRTPGGPAPEPPTLVFSHGYCLDQDVWHFQRAALRGAVRTVWWDQRSHGRSGRGPVGGEVSIDLLGRDLKAVLDAAVPSGPVVLVGHSMGGMTVMALAAQYPEYVAERVVGVALLGTSAGRLAEVTYGLPAAGVRAARRVLPGVLRALVAQTELVERGRRAAADVFAGLVKRYSFGSPREVDPGVARFAERLLESVPIDVVAEFLPAFGVHDKREELRALSGAEVLVLAADRDLITPVQHSEEIAAALPQAQLAVLERTGHLAMLERPEEVNEELAALLTRTIRSHGSTAPPDRGPRDDRTARGR
ncbi:alpha/beta fold hydrolase [Streptomyces xiaopingdaonensis]|uniref:alpha/beta fold hydrolase n=1 Tax=Streptomyces xiaopingdaonensis TaxID=1565415 RepID=UPI000314A34F|nr:alpha/beta hydrolase [Streptomyces xiaopingdaonensis]